MKTILIFFALMGTTQLCSQSCVEFLSQVKSSAQAMTLNTYENETVKSVSFYDLIIDAQYRYFAIVCFKTKSECNEYLYEVNSLTKTYYSLYYLSSPLNTFQEYIDSYNHNLGCAPVLKNENLQNIIKP